jgi:hypothetical protein
LEQELAELEQQIQATRHLILREIPVPPPTPEQENSEQEGPEPTEPPVEIQVINGIPLPVFNKAPAPQPVKPEPTGAEVAEQAAQDPYLPELASSFAQLADFRFASKDLLLEQRTRRKHWRHYCSQIQPLIEYKDAHHLSHIPLAGCPEQLLHCYHPSWTRAGNQFPPDLTGPVFEQYLDNICITGSFLQLPVPQWDDYEVPAVPVQPAVVDPSDPYYQLL